jgi:hypothetical protein
MHGNILRSGATLILFGYLAGCGGGGGGGGNGGGNPPPPPPPPPAAVQSGVFKDTNVVGLDFVSGQESGTTDSDGRYSCETGNDVSFSVGAVVLGSAQCTTLLSPPALVTSGRFDDPEAVNIARFLQLLDVDATPDNNITISSGLQAVADSWPAIDFAAADLDAQLTMVFSDIQSVDNRTVTATPDVTTAFEHMDETLACAYGGAFIGTLSGSNSGSVAFVTGRRLFGFSPDEFSFMAYDPDEEFVISTSGDFTFSANSVLDSSRFDQSVIVQAEFETPDTLSGTWNYPPESRSGTLNASRLGDGSGVGRIVGEFFAFESRGVFSISADADGNFSGEAFDVADNSRYQISAPLPQTNPFDLTVSGNGTSFTVSALLFVDASGVVRMDGSWDDGSQSGGQLSGIYCDLNPMP